MVIHVLTWLVFQLRENACVFDQLHFDITVVMMVSSEYCINNALLRFLTYG